MPNPDYTPLVPDRKPLNEVRYSGKDFQSIFDSVLRRLKTEYSDIYNDYATSSLGVMLIDLMAYATAQLIWYLDRTSSDCFLDTARTRAAVARLVKQIGYKIAAATASSTTLDVTFPQGALVPFPIPQGYRIAGPNGLFFETYADKLINPAPLPGDTTTLDVRQGETRTLIYTSDGTPNQSYRLSNIGTDRYLADGSVMVWVDGSPWDEVRFLDYLKTNQFEVGYVDDPPTVQFGDGVAGNKPPDAAEIKIRFTIIDGLKGNVKANTIRTAVDTIMAGGLAVSVQLTNPLGSSGGTDPETAARAKALAPFAFAARDAAITLPDYIALANSYSDPMYGRVAVAYAFNPRAAYEDTVFNAMIDAIETLLVDYRTTVDALESQISTGATSMDAVIAAMGASNTELATLVAAMTGYLASAQSQIEGARTANSLYGNIVEDIGTIVDQVVFGTTPGIPSLPEIKLQVNGSSANAPEKSAINNQLDLLGNYILAIDTLTDQLESKQTTVDGAIDSALGFIFEAQTITDDPTPPSPLVTFASIQLANTDNIVLLDYYLNDAADGILPAAQEISGTAAALQSAVNDILTLMHGRIGELFDADCLSNYVQVPILAYDSEGAYVPPSAGLIIGLQTHLNKIKEVTQDVEVIDGSFNLVPAQIVVQVKVTTEAVPSEVTSQIQATIAGILRARQFNQPLYLDWLYKNVKTIPGIEFVNIEIVGPVAELDSEGNLVPPPTKIITFGTLNIGVV